MHRSTGRPRATPFHVEKRVGSLLAPDAGLGRKVEAKAHVRIVWAFTSRRGRTRRSGAGTHGVRAPQLTVKRGRAQARSAASDVVCAPARECAVLTEDPVSTRVFLVVLVSLGPCGRPCHVCRCRWPCCVSGRLYMCECLCLCDSPCGPLTEESSPGEVACGCGEEKTLPDISRHRMCVERARGAECDCARAPTRTKSSRHACISPLSTCSSELPR